MIQDRDARLREEDKESRRRAQRDFVHPVVLEAGAGTGKTATLVARILSWCMGEGWRRAPEAESRRPGADAQRVAVRVMERVVAITFTEAAAGEMLAKITTALSQVHQGKLPIGMDEEVLPEDPEERRYRAGALLQAIDHLVVRTIHAYCKRLLTAWPLEAKIHPEFTVDADGTELEAIVDLVVAERAREAYTPADRLYQDFVTLAELGVGPADISAALLKLAEEGVPASALAVDPLPPEKIAPLWRNLSATLYQFIEVDAGRLGAIKKAPATQKAANWIHDLYGRLGNEGDDATALVSILTAEPSEDALKRLTEWSKDKFIKTEQAVLGDTGPLRAVVRRLLPLLQQLLFLDPRRLHAGRRVLAELLQQVHHRLRGKGVLTFSALLVQTRDLLQRSPEVRRVVREGIDQLLVDEFQDTDAVQCDIIRMLALEGDKRPGLFLVGDPKQSIYGWRSADLAAFEGFVREAENAGGKRHRLRVNFRSVPMILEEVERVCTPIMPAIPGLQPRFEPLVADEKKLQATGFRDGLRAPVEHQVSWRWEDKPVTNLRSEEATMLETRALARDLRALHDQYQVPWKEMVVLMRATGDVDDYAGALREANIPYAVTRDRSYYQRREIIDASSLIRTILDPLDHVALVATLRSALCGVPDGALIPLWIQRFPQLMSELHIADPVRLTQLEERVRAAAAMVSPEIPGIQRVVGWERALMATVRGIAALRGNFSKEAPDRWVEQLRRLLLLEATEAARYQGVWRLANLERFLRQLLKALEEGTGDEQEVLRALRKGVAEEKDAAEGKPMDASAEVVQVMTIHKAKGLDFGHVYVVQHHKKGRAGGAQKVDYQEVPGGQEYVLFGARTLGYSAVLERRQLVEYAERVRLLYVALTRAKERVVTMGAWPTVQPMDFREAETFGELMANRPDIPELADAMREAASRSVSYWDSGAARWRFPALEEKDQRDAPPSEAPPLPDLPSLASIASASQRLLRLRSAADEHMKRSYATELHADGSGSSVPAGRESPRSLLPASRVEKLMPAVGAAVVRVLADWEPDHAPGMELVRLRRRLEPRLREEVDPSELSACLAAAGRFLERFAAGPLPERLAGLCPTLGVPLLLGPSTGEVGYRSTTLDLLWEEDGRIILGFWRMEEPADDAAAQHLGHQARRELAPLLEGAALAFGKAIRAELWFVATGRIGRVAWPASGAS